MYNILIVDDHTLVINGFKTILTNFPQIKIVGEALNGVEALKLIETLNPNIVLLDINMPEMNGIECLKEIKRLYPTTKVIILSMHHEEIYVLKAVKNNVDGYLMKNCEIEELISAIELVGKGEKYISKKISLETLKKATNPTYVSNFNENFNLSTREIEIIKALSEGLTNKEISEKLFISDRTVNTHRTNIMFKMQVKNSVELVVKALEQKIITIR